MSQKFNAATALMGPAHRGILTGIFEGEFPVGDMAWRPQEEEDQKRAQAVIQSVKEAFLGRLSFVRYVETKEEVPLHIVEEMSRIGLFRLKVPVEMGGLGLHQWGYNQVLQFVASISDALAAYVSAHNSLGGVYPLVHKATKEQRDFFLPKVCVWPTGFCFTERNVGSDPFRTESYAVRVRNERGVLTGYRLFGEKWFTTNILRAEFVVVNAIAVDDPAEMRGDSEKLHTLFLVPTKTPGVRIPKANRFAGMRGIDNANPVFENVSIPVFNRIGEEGDGFKIALGALNSGRIAVAAICAAAAKQAVAISRWWAEERKQMGGPIGDNELIAEKLTYGAAYAFAMQSMVDHASERTDRGLDAAVEAAMTKAFVSEEAWNIVDDMMQIRGGRGYMEEDSLADAGEFPAPCARIWRGLRVARIFEGATQILELWTIREGMRKNMDLATPFFVKNKKDFFAFGNIPKLMKSVAAFAAWYCSSLKSGLSRRALEAVPPQLRKHMEYAEKATRRIPRELMMAGRKYQAKIIFKQCLVERAFLIAAHIYGIYTSVLRAAYLAENGHPEALELANAFGYLAKDRIEELFRDLDKRSDRLNRGTSRAIRDGKFKEVLESGIVLPIPESAR